MDSILAGISGEYFVAGELSRRGWVASITLRNTNNIDILASNGNQTINIQVKTKREGVSSSWAMSSKSLEQKSEYKNTFYVFVDLPRNLEGKIKYFIIPKNELNKKVEQKHQEWLKEDLNRTSQHRRLILNRHPEFNTEKYEDNWNQLFNC